MKYHFSTTYLKEILAKRTDNHCSNPDCRQITISPFQLENATSILLVVEINSLTNSFLGYFIRIDENEDFSIENIIWLCMTTRNG